jgi:magnesium chelatase family protein
MSLAVVLSRGLAGLDAPLVTVECHAGNGLPKFSLVGLPETEVRRRATACARRCRTGISNFDFPPRKITDGLESERPFYA